MAKYTFADFEKKYGLDWFPVITEIADITGWGCCFADWCNSQSFHSYTGVETWPTLEDIQRRPEVLREDEVVLEWTSKTSEEVELIMAIGLWMPKGKKSFYASEAARIKGGSVQGLHDAIPFPCPSLFFDREKIMAAARKCGLWGEPNPGVAEAREKYAQERAERERRKKEEEEQRKRKEKEESAQRQRNREELRSRVIPRAKPILEQAPLPAWATSFVHEIFWNGRPEDPFFIRLETRCAVAYLHARAVETAGSVEAAATRILNHVSRGGEWNTEV